MDRPRARALAALASSLCALGACAPAAAALPRGACPPPAAQVVERGSEAVVYEVARRLRACLTRSGVHRPLASRRRAGGGPVAVAGRRVAFDVEGACGDFCPRVRILDLSSGRAVEGMPAFDVHESPPVHLLALDARGRAAYLRGGARPELRAIDAAGDEPLDASGSVEPASIRIAGSRVLWRSGGEARSHRLGGPLACARRGSATLARSAEARVYRYAGTTWGCHARSGTRVAMGPAVLDTWEYHGGDHVHLAGGYATVDAGYGGRGGGRADLRAWDLSTGALVHAWRCCDGAFASLGAVVLAPTGGVAWSAYHYGGQPAQGTAAVRKSDADGEAIVLDSGPEVEPRSLRLDGDTVSWRHGEQTRSATLR